MPLAKGQKLRSKDERRRLALEVWGARLRGMSLAEIGKAKNLPLSTVWWLLQESKRLTKFEFTQLTQEEIRKEFWLEGKERVKTLWLLFANHKDNPIIQVRCVEAIGVESERMIRIATSLGLIAKEPDTINVTLVAEIITYGILDTIPDPDTRHRLAATLGKRLAAIGVGGDSGGQPQLSGPDGR